MLTNIPNGAANIKGSIILYIQLENLRRKSLKKVKKEMAKKNIKNMNKMDKRILIEEFEAEEEI